MRLIDADALIEDLEYDAELDARALDDTDLLLGRNRELVQFDKDCKQNTVDMLKKLPTVDAVPVIRCCDCIYFEYLENQFVQMTHCDVHDRCPDYTDYCSWAVRKEE